MPGPQEISRRRFLTLAGAGSACLLVDPARLVAAQEIVAEEPWAHVVRLADGVWAIASTPIESSDWRTGCNGGLVAGSERTLAIEGFLRPDGAAWVADVAAPLTGRRPTDVLVTHYHGDHANGLQGYRGDEAPRVWMTETTRGLIRAADAAREGGHDSHRRQMLDTASILSEESVTELDLGGRTVRFHPRGGHTASDVTAELDDPSVVFCGDLVWNGFFPNYRDTIPTPFAESIRALRRERPTHYVSGHGSLADERAVELLLTLVDAVEAAARDAWEKGVPAAEAAGAFRLPDPVSEWVLFNERYFEVAIGAWHAELGAAD